MNGVLKILGLGLVLISCFYKQDGALVSNSACYIAGVAYVCLGVLLGKLDEIKSKL